MEGTNPPSTPWINTTTTTTTTTRQNLLLSPNGDLQLCDFGWSISAGGPGGGDSNSRLRHTLCGTPDYIAPEMLRNEPYFGAY